MHNFLWWLALAALAGAIVVAVTVGGNAALGAGFAAIAVLLLAAIADPPAEDRRPW